MGHNSMSSVAQMKKCFGKMNIEQKNGNFLQAMMNMARNGGTEMERKEKKMHRKWTVRSLIRYVCSLFHSVAVCCCFCQRSLAHTHKQTRTYIFYKVCSRFVSFIFLVLLFLVQTHVPGNMYTEWQRHKNLHKMGNTCALARFLCSNIVDFCTARWTLLVAAIIGWETKYDNY